MKKRTIAILIALVLILAIAIPVAAITNGEPDAGRHPYVGLMVAGYETEDGDFLPGWRCSGALIAPDVFLTAGHCTDDSTKVVVWFEEGPVGWGTWDPSTNPTCAGETGYPCTGDAFGTPYTNPKYRSDENPYGGGNGLPAFSYRDVGIVVLDTEFDGLGLAELPTAGLVDTLKNKTDIDFVGYGVQYQAKIPGKYLPSPPPYFRWTGLRQRLFAQSEMVSGKFVHSAEYMRLALNPGGGSGGTCFGDSGGPDLLAETNTVLAVNSYVTNINCSGVGYSARVDIPEVLDWIDDCLEGNCVSLYP
jgi:hypothetical protein